MFNLLLEGPPKNPNEVIVQNEFYPKGLTEQQIYDYYIKYKQIIVNEVEDRELMFFIGIDVNKTIVKRKDKMGFLRLDSKNYESLITGRTLSIHSTMRRREDIGIVDIDYHNFEDAKRATGEVYNYLQRISSAHIRFTGKDSFHVVCRFKQKMNIDNIRQYLQNLLSQKFEDDYIVGGRRSIKRPNLDLSPDKYRGGFITLGSLSVLGLRCMIIHPSSLSSFRKEDARV